MNKELKEIPIFFAIDDGYTPFLAVALKSLIDNASKDYKYLIKVLHTNVQEEHMKQIKKYEEENINIEFVDLNYYIEKVQDKLFKEMITTKGKNGTGLGLYMSYSTIKAHFNGNITFESVEGKGTTFNIILPL